MKAIIVLIIILLIAAYRGVKRIILNIEDDRKRFVALKLYRLNVIAFIPCVIVCVVVVKLISDRLEPVYDDLETFGLTDVTIYNGEEDGMRLARVDDGRLVLSLTGFPYIYVMKNGDLSVVYKDGVDYYTVDGVPISPGRATFYRLFDSLNYDYYVFFIWGGVLVLLVVTNIIGYGIYKTKAEKL